MHFDMKNLGEATNYILGMHIKEDRSKRLLYLSQFGYINKVCKHFNMEGGKALSMPLPSYVKFSANDCPKSNEKSTVMAKVPYASPCVSLMYAMVATRLDIAHAVGVVNKFMSNPRKKHWEVVKTIFRYLSGTADWQFCYGRGDLSIQGYVDSDYTGYGDSRKSTTGWVYTFAGLAISWRSILQNCISISTTEPKYITTSEA